MVILQKIVLIMFLINGVMLVFNCIAKHHLSHTFSGMTSVMCAKVIVGSCNQILFVVSHRDFSG